MSGRGHASGQRSPRVVRPTYAAGLDGALLRITDGALAGCLFVVPMMMGGRQALGQLTLTALAVTAAVAWGARQCVLDKARWRWSWSEWLLLAGTLLLVLQVTPLPAAVLTRLAPHTSELLPLWGSSGELPNAMGTWSQVSLTPSATGGALVIFISYSLLFLVTTQRVRTVGDVERLLRWCGLSVLLMAAFGLAQLLAGNGKFFWFYEHPHTNTLGVAKGAFTNRNHFASFLALGIGPLIWWAQQGFQKQPRRSTARFRGRSSGWRNTGLENSLRTIALGVTLFAVLLSLSRGGALAALLATIVCVTVCYRASRIGTRMMVGLTGVGLLIVVALGIFGQERVSQRLGELTQGSVEAVDHGQGRRTIWNAVIKAVPDYALLGSGVGSHREVYPMYLESTDSHKYYSHAECSPLQVLLETGVVGLALVLTGIGFCGFWCVGGLLTTRDDRVFLCLGAVTAGLAANLLHSAVDFIWYVPGCMAMVAVLLACACRLWQLRGGDTEKGLTRTAEFPCYVVAVATLALLVGGVVMLDNRAGLVLAERHWEQCLRLDQEAFARELARENERRQAADAMQQTSDEWRNLADFGQGQADSAAVATTERMIRELRDVVRWDPGHARAHLRLAQAYVQLFHEQQEGSPNAMPLSQVRDAVIASQSEAIREGKRSEEIPPHKRLDRPEAVRRWLSVAIGKRSQYLDLALRHSRRSLELCPLHGEAYLLLGQLCFLEGEGASTKKRAYVSQAIKVRPYNGAVLLDAGFEAILAGEESRARSYWRQSFQTGFPAQKRLIDSLLGNIQPGYPQAEIQFFLRTFQPDSKALSYLDSCYSRIAPAEQMTDLWVARAAAAEAEARRLDGSEAAEAWLDAMASYRRLGYPTERLRCGRAALDCDRSSYLVRERLGFCLADLEQFGEAKQHFLWCLNRRPNDARLKRRAIQATKEELRRRDQTTAHGSTPRLH